MMKKRKVIVFDLDDTLYHEIDYLKSAYLEVALYLEENYNISDAYEFMFSKYNEKKNVFEETNSKYGLNIPINEYLFIYRNHIPNICLTPKVTETLEILKQDSGIILGLLTDGRSITQRNKIHSLKLYKYIDKTDCIISEEYGYSKPSIEGYLYFQDKYLDAFYFYIGDNTNKDFIAPNMLGWNSICLSDYGLNIHKQDFSLPNDIKAKIIINDISEIFALLKKYQ